MSRKINKIISEAQAKEVAYELLGDICEQADEYSQLLYKTVIQTFCDYYAHYINSLATKEE